jgi:single-strand selective monofunctional uracil DNA glycosylase
MQLRDISRALARRVDRLAFGPPVAHVYDPLVYARASHELYLERWGGGAKFALFLGMNPGPFGMGQTGVPFGEVAAARDFLGCEAPVLAPRAQHPQRPIEGYACRRSEVSGQRLWGWVRQRFGTPERFFARYFVHNYCPLLFLGETGSNLTPDKLPREQTAELYAACDDALRALVEALGVEWVIGVGAFAEKRARAALQGCDLQFGTIPHPSPASPLANRGWAPAAEQALARYFAIEG